MRVILAIILLSIPIHSQSQTSHEDWVRDDSFFSMGGLYTQFARSVDMGDIDGDGLEDLVFSTIDGRIEIYRDTGLQGSARWEFMPEWSNTIDLGIDPNFPMGRYATVTDLDNDSLPELIICGLGYEISTICLERGSNDSFHWVRAQHLIQGIPSYLTHITAADIDFDGDTDLAALNHETGGIERGYFILFENIGTPTDPIWTQNLQYFPSWNTHAFEIADIDSDEDYDMVTVELSCGPIMYPYLHINEGSSDNPNWTSVGSFEWIYGSYSAELAAGDFNQDGDKDFFYMTWPQSQLYLLEMDASGNTIDLFDPEWIAGPVHGYTISNPAFTDLDSDDNLDLVMITTAGNLGATEWINLIFLNNGTDDHPEWVFTDELNVPSGTQMAFGDIDRDGRQDLFVPQAYGEPRFYWRGESQAYPTWIQDPDVASRLPEISYLSDPSFVDIDNDGLMDFSCRWGWERHFYHNVGTPTNPNWVEREEWSYGLPDGYIQFTDLNGDDLSDAVLYSFDDTLQCYLRTGDQVELWNESHEYLSGLNVRFPSEDMQSTCYPEGFALENLDGGARNDLVLGMSDGRVVFYSNTGPVQGEIPEIKPSDLITAFPNPTRGNNNIRLMVPLSGKISFSLYDVTGRIIECFDTLDLDEGASPITLPLNGDQLTPNTYFIQMQHAENTWCIPIVIIP